MQFDKRIGQKKVTDGWRISILEPPDRHFWGTFFGMNISELLQCSLRGLHRAILSFRRPLRRHQEGGKEEIGETKSK